MFFALYALLATRTVQGGDVSEFIRLGITPGGVAHPPGYPLYTLICKLFGVLPFGGAAFRVSLSSGLFAALGVSLLFLILLALEHRRSTALIAAIILGFSQPYWKVAGVAEVLSLHAFLVLLLVFLVAKPEMRSARRSLCLGVVGGLGLAHHHTIVFALPLCLAGLWRAWREQPTGTGSPPGVTDALKLLAISIGGVLLGLLPYAYLFVAGDNDWTWVRIDSASAFWDHFTRRQYGTFSLRGAGASAHTRWTYLGWSLMEQTRGLGYLGALLGAVGCVYGIRWARTRTLAIGLALTWTCSGLVFPLLFHIPLDAVGRSVIERFLVMPCAILCVFAGMGLHALWQHLSERRQRLFAVAGVACSLLLAPLHLDDASWRHRTLIERFVKDALSDAPDRAVIFGQGDHLLHSFQVVQHEAGSRWASRLYVDLHLLRTRHYYDWVKARWPGMPLPFHPRLTRISYLFRTRTKPARPICFVDTLPVLRRVPHYPRGTLLCLGSLTPERLHVLNMTRVDARGLPRRPDPRQEPWGSLVWPHYFRSLITVHNQLRAQRKHGRADYIARILERYGLTKRR